MTIKINVAFILLYSFCILNAAVGKIKDFKCPCGIDRNQYTDDNSYQNDVKRLIGSAVRKKNKSDFRIVGGLEPNYPVAWMAALLIKRKTDFTTRRCGAVLINSKFLLTAAHCLCNNQIPLPCKLKRGTWRPDYDITEIIKENINVRTISTHVRIKETKIKRAFIHKKFLKNTTINAYKESKDGPYDIGMVELMDRINFYQTETRQVYTMPICLPSKTFLDAGINATEKQKAEKDVFDAQQMEARIYLEEKQEQELKKMREQAKKIMKDVENQITNSLSPKSLSRRATECPVCWNPMEPPVRIFQYGQGHHICEACKNHPEVKRCPMCSQQITGRNIGMEQLILELAEESTNDLENKGPLLFNGQPLPLALKTSGTVRVTGGGGMPIKVKCFAIGGGAGGGFAGGGSGHIAVEEISVEDRMEITVTIGEGGEGTEDGNETRVGEIIIAEGGKRGSHAGQGGSGWSGGGSYGSERGGHGGSGGSVGDGGQGSCDFDGGTGQGIHLPEVDTLQPGAGGQHWCVFGGGGGGVIFQQEKNQRWISERGEGFGAGGGGGGGGMTDEWRGRNGLMIIFW